MSSRRKLKRFPGLFRPKGSNTYHLRAMIGGQRVSRSTGETDINAAWERAEALRLEIRAELAERAKREADPVYKAGRQPIGEHLDDWAEAMRAKGRSAKYIRQTIGRVRRVMERAKAKTLAELNLDRVARAISRAREPEREGERGISAQTANHWRRVCKQFTHWLMRAERLRTDPLAHLDFESGVTRDLRHERRPLDRVELRLLLDLLATDKAEAAFRIEPTDRARLYRAAAFTGLRANELATLTWGAVETAGEAPSVTVRAAYAKNGRERQVPLHRDIAAMLTRWRAERSEEPSRTAVFRMPSLYNVAKMLRADLEAARAWWIAQAEEDAGERARREATDTLRYVDEIGRFADFHALRHMAATELVEAGVPLHVAKDILGHADISTTEKHYRHARFATTTPAVNLLPSLEPCNSQAKAS